MNFSIAYRASNTSTPPWLHSTFKELSNHTSHAQFRVKMKKLFPQQVEEEKPIAEQKLCRDIFRLCCDKASDKARNFVVTKFLCHDKVRRQTLLRQSFYVVTKSEDKLCRDKIFMSRQSFLYVTTLTPGQTRKAQKFMFRIVFKPNFP